jgi:hypothetical protein
MEENVACPVCNKLFSPSKINVHVNSCLNNGDDSTAKYDNDHNGRKRKLNAAKSGWGFLMSNDNSNTNASSKKIKLSPLAKIHGKEVPVITIDDADDSERTLVTLPENELNKQKSKSVIEDKTDKQKQNGLDKVKPEGSPAKKHLLLDMSIPLAERMRPICFENYIGQDKALGKDKMLWSLLQGDNTPSMILWGPPGCGKVFNFNNLLVLM